MKVIIELSEFFSIESVDGHQVKINMTNDDDIKGYIIVEIDSLQTALRKLTAK